MREFLLENQDIKLENLPKYEDIISAMNKRINELKASNGKTLPLAITMTENY